MEGEAQPQFDAFGEPVKPVETGTAANPPAPTGEPAADKFVEVDGVKYVDDGNGQPKVDDKGEKVKFTEPKKEGGEDIENHPVVVGLKTELERVKNEMGGNLSGQREVIDRLEKTIKDIREGRSPDGVEPIHKDIKRVKDLPQEQQEAMSDTEKQLFDQLADLKEAQNRDHAARQKEANDAKERAEKEGKDNLAAVATSARSEAMKLANGKTDVANQIINNFNLFKDNDKLTETQVKERVAQAARMIPEWKPPKEQPKHEGGKPPATGKDNDPHGVDKIVDEVSKGRQAGGYAL